MNKKANTILQPSTRVKICFSGILMLVQKIDNLICTCCYFIHSPASDLLSCRKSMSNVVQTELQAIAMVKAKEESWYLKRNLWSHSLSSQIEILWIKAVMWKDGYFQPLSEIRKKWENVKWQTHQLSFLKVFLQWSSHSFIMFSASFINFRSNGRTVTVKENQTINRILRSIARRVPGQQVKWMKQERSGTI